MMHEQFQVVLAEIIDTLLEAAKTNERLRSNLRIVAEEVLLATDVVWHPERSTEEASFTDVMHISVSMPHETAQEIVTKSLEAACSAPVTQFAQATGAPPKSYELKDAQGWPLNIPTLIDHLSFKADAARWAAERQRTQTKRGSVWFEMAAKDDDFFTKATGRTYLWMLAPGCPASPTAEHFDVIADCYETVVKAIQLTDVVLRIASPEPGDVEESLTLLAEAQSALRVAVAKGGGYVDVDQGRIYHALKTFAEEHRIFIQAGMKISEPTDPSERTAIAESVEVLRQQISERESVKREQRKLLGKLKHKSSQLAKVLEPTPGDWTDLINVVEETVRAGVQPSRIEIRNAVLPIVDRLSVQAGSSKELGWVLREIERAKSQPSGQSEPTLERPSDAVAAAAKLLAGKSLVLIGGEGRRSAREAIKKAFGLSHVEWIATTPHESYHNFEPYIAREEVAVVLLLTRWTSHSFGGVKAVCDRLGKAFVKVPAGYNPTQLAAEIMSQVGHRLNRQTD